MSRQYLSLASTMMADAGGAVALLLLAMFKAFQTRVQR